MENERRESSRRKFIKSVAALAGASIGYTWLKVISVYYFLQQNPRIRISHGMEL